MLKDLIERTFAVRNIAHVAHWKTDSGFHHQVLGAFYEKLPELLDRFVEAQIGAISDAADLPEQVESVTKVLQEEMIWLTENRASLSHGIPALENMLDELTGEYMSAVFKLSKMR